MSMDIWKNTSALVLLLVFLLLRIVNLHSFSHFADNDDDRIHCELCDSIVVTQELTPFTKNTFVPLTEKTAGEFFVCKTNFCYETSQHSITLPITICNKPPPII